MWVYTQYIIYNTEKVTTQIFKNIETGTYTCGVKFQILKIMLTEVTNDKMLS